MDIIQLLNKGRSAIYRFLNIFLIFGCLFFTYPSFWNIETVKSVHVFIALGLILLICLFSYFKSIGRSILAALIIVSILIVAFIHGFPAFGRAFMGYPEWLKNPSVSGTYVLLYQTIQITGLILISFLLCLLTDKFSLVRYLLMILALALSITLLIMEKKVLKAGSVCIFAFILIGIIDAVEARWKKKRIEKNKKTFMVFAWPVWLSFILLLAILPAPEKPYDWKFFINIYNKFATAIEKIQEFSEMERAEDFDMKMAGFSERGALGGNLQGNGNIALHVNSDRYLNSNLYLSGVHLDSFDGREWTGSISENQIDKRIDTLETLYGLRLLGMEDSTDIVRSTRITVLVRNLNSKFFFTPGKMTYFNMNNHDLLEPGNYNDKLWDTFKKFGDDYRCNYLQFNVNHPIISNFRKDSITDSEADWIAITDKFRLPEVSFAKLQKYRDSVKDLYLPDTTLSPEMQKWVNKVTEGCTSDIQKLRAIETALRRLTYTMEPGQLPDKVKTPSDFLDYFVLESKEGYCTYYATAFTLIARAEGYPARYVQGFCVPMINERTLDVLSETGHAWSEVYFEGLGWIPFEPTAGYEDLMYTDPWPEDTEDAVTAEPVTEPETTVYTTSDQSQTDTLEHDNDGTDIRSYIIYGAATIPVILLIVFFINILISRSRYDKLDNSQKLKLEVDRNIVVLRKLGITKKDSETLGELNAKLEECLQAWEEPPMTFLKEYEKVIYGGSEITIEMIRSARNERINALHMLSKFNRFIERFYIFKNCKKIK